MSVFVSQTLTLGLVLEKIFEIFEKPSLASFRGGRTVEYWSEFVLTHFSLKMLCWLLTPRFGIEK